MIRHGLLLIDKPTGMTSHDLVHNVRRWSSQKQVGHAGTLDPLATGLMVVLMGEATKLSDYLLNGDKAYDVELKLGVVTDTGDSDGQVVQEKAVAVTTEQVAQSVSELQGEFQWPVPIYSAVKKNGKKLYELARENKPVEAPVKTMIFKKVELLGFESDRVRVHLACSKGSFVRTWVDQLGKALGCGATVVGLRRTASIPFGLERAMTLDTLVAGDSQTQPEASHWVPLSSSLPDWWPLKVEGQDERLLRNGQIPYRLERFLEIEVPPHVPGVKVLRRRDGELLALLTRENQRFVIKRAFQVRH